MRARARSSSGGRVETTPVRFVVPTRLGRAVKPVLFVAVSAVCACSLFGLAANHLSWSFFLDQPRVHYAAFLLMSLPILLLCRYRRLALVTALFLVLDLSLLFPCVRPTTIAHFDASVAVIHANLGRQTEPPMALIAYVEERGPDFICLQELTPELASELSAVFPGHVVLASEPRTDSRGVALLVKSRLPDTLRVRSTEIVRFVAAVTDRPTIETLLSMDDQPLRLLSFHSKRPSNAETLDIQTAEYRALADWFQRRPDVPAVAVGDFNATPWSRRVRGLLSQASLPHTQTGFSLRPSWPSGSIGLLGIPIDLCVHNSFLQVVEGEVGPNIGSDHYPIYFRLSRLTSDDR